MHAAYMDCLTSIISSLTRLQTHIYSLWCILALISVPISLSLPPSLSLSIDSVMVATRRAAVTALK